MLTKKRASGKKRITVKKKGTVKKKAVSRKKEIPRKKAYAKKKVTVKAHARKGMFVSKTEPGYEITESGLFIPSNIAKPVSASKLRAGFKKARKEINSIIEEVVSTMTQSYAISEIEFSASFSADGKFMGFGVGGAATMKIKIRPVE
jgi:hypothetical protein